MGIVKSIRAGLNEPKLFAMEAKKVYTYKLLNTLNSYMMDREYAIIAIALRLSTVGKADRINSVGDGRISEYGPHSDLVSKDGAYAELYAIQS